MVATTNAIVHYDNLPVWTAATFWDESNPVTTQGDVLVTVPSGSFAFSAQVPFYWHKPGWVIAGQGDDKTEWFSPKGTVSINFLVFESPSTTIRDMRFTGNVGDHGYGTTYYAASVDITLSPNTVLTNVVTVNVWRGLNVSYSGNTKATNFRAYLMEPLRHYISWQIAFANSEGGGCWNCAVFSKYVTAALESFQSSGQSYIGTRLFNGMFSSNSSQSLIIDDLYIRIAAGSAHLRDILYNPLVNNNLNIDSQQGATTPPGGGGTYKNVNMVQDGYVGADPSWGKWFMASGINIDGRTSELNVIGGSYWVPDVMSDNITKAGGVLGVNNYGGNKNIVVDGFVSCGLTDTPPQWQHNIRNQGDPTNVVRNSKARLIDAGTQENNSNNPGPCLPPGPFPDISPPPMNAAVVVPPPVIPPPVIVVKPSFEWRSYGGGNNRRWELLEGGVLQPARDVSKTAAETLCGKLKALGASCVVR